jgi:Undecaprenyl-phosphate glucose phosphotransferase
MHPLRAMKPLSIRWSVIFLMVAALTAVAHAPNHYSRFWFAGFYAGGMVSIGAERWLLARFIREWIRRGHYSLSVAIVGGNLLAEKLILKFAGNPWGIRFTGIFDDRARDNPRHIAGVPVLGNIGDLLIYAKSHDLDTIILTIPMSPSDRIHDIIRQLRQQPVSVRLLPGAIGLERVSPIRLDSTELPGVQLISVADRPISDFALLAKGIFDRLAALTGLIMIAPLLCICAVGIKLASPGPVFFRQKRVGYKGRDFDILKFRTMHVAPVANTELTRRDDTRVFKFGSLLRRTSFDELPQLINVLKGDMSLVGPRPHMPEARAAGRYYFDVVDEYANRQRVKPGITGWAQVNGWRGPTETVEQIERRVEHDIYYIENWSLFLDFIIIVKTILVGFHGKNAF